MPPKHHALWWGAGLMCAAGTCALTLSMMGQSPLRLFPSAPAALPDTTGMSHAAPSTPPSAGPAIPLQTDGFDVLAELTKPHGVVVPRSPTQSNTLDEALQRALAYPVFSSLASRQDPEGLFEAAAWASGCSQHAMQNDALRCSDPALRDPAFAAKLLRSAASAGQPGAVLQLAVLNPVQWRVLPLTDGAMLGDRVFAMAAHGDLGALEFLKQWCGQPGTCQEAPFARNVLTALQVQFAGPESPDYRNYMDGDDTQRQRAIDRATQLLKTLPR